MLSDNIQIVREVGECGFIDNTAYYIKNRKIFKFPSEEIMSLSNDYWGVNFFKNLFNIFTSRSCNKFYNYNGKKLIEYDNINLYYAFSKNNLIYFDRNDRKTKYNDFVIVDGKIGKLTIEKDCLFFERNSMILSFSLLKSTIIWQKQFLKKVKFNSFISVYKNQVLISCSNSIIISLNVETGELIYQYNLAEESSNLQPYLEDDPAIAYFIREDEGILIILTRVALFHINLHTHQIKIIKDYINLPKEQRWEFKAATIKENKAYFTGDLGQEYAAATHLGVLDVNTGEVLWQQQFKDKLYLPDAPQVSDDKLYVTVVNSDTVKKDLYIFEKEDVCF